MRYSEGVEGLNKQIEEAEAKRLALQTEIDQVDRTLVQLYQRRAGKPVPGTYCLRCGKVAVSGRDPHSPHMERTWCDPCQAIVRSGGT